MLLTSNLQWHTVAFVHWRLPDEKKICRKLHTVLEFTFRHLDCIHHHLGSHANDPQRRNFQGQSPLCQAPQPAVILSSRFYRWPVNCSTIQMIPIEGLVKNVETMMSLQRLKRHRFKAKVHALLWEVSHGDVKVCSETPVRSAWLHLFLPGGLK